MAVTSGSTKRDMKLGEPGDAQELTPAVINQINWRVREENPDPVQSRRILQFFMDHTADRRVTLPWEVYEFLRFGIEAFLADGREGVLERGLGLRRKNQRPQENEKRNQQIARDVLRERLKGSTALLACVKVSSKYGIRENKVSDIWAIHKYTAFCFEAAGRSGDSKEKKCQWTETEIARLKKMYGSFIIDVPRKSPDKPGGSK